MSAIRSNEREGQAPPSSSTFDSTYRFFSSVRFAIVVLSFIAVSCVVGTLIQQQAAPQEYLKEYSDSTYAILKFLGLTDVFHAWWFHFLAGLLVLNLILCTLDRLGRTLRASRELDVPNQKTLSAMSNGFLAKGMSLDDVAPWFKAARSASGGGKCTCPSA